MLRSKKTDDEMEMSCQDNTLLNNDSLTTDPVDPNNISITSFEPSKYLYWACFAQGIGMLFPWNVFITAASYFTLRFAHTSIESTFEQAFSFSYTFANLIIFLVLLRYGTTPTFDLRLSIVVPNVITAGLFFLAAIFVYIPMDGGLLFTLTIISVLLCGAFAASLQAGIFGLTARLPYQYTQAVVGGQGAAGATVSLLSLLSLLSQDCSNEKETAATATATATPTLNAIKTQSFAYFFSSAVVVLICLGIFVWLTKTEFVKQTINGEGGNSNILSTPALPQSNTLSSNDDTTSDWFVLVRILWRHCLGVCFTFMITLAIFPGLTADIQSYNNPYDETCPATGIIYGFGVWQSFLFLLFNVGDTFGRQLTLLGSVIKPKNVWILAMCRVIFIPLFMTLNLRQNNDINGKNVNMTFSPSSSSMEWNGNSSSSSSGSGVVIGGSGGSDFWPCLLMLLMAVSNGYCTGLEMSNGPKQCIKKEDQSRAGTLLAFFMTLGLLLGSLLAFPVRAMV